MWRFFQSLGKVGNLIYHHWKFLLVPKECPLISCLLRHLQPAGLYNFKGKLCYIGRHTLPKESTFSAFLPFCGICLTQCGTGWSYTFTNVSGQETVVKECWKASISRHIIFKRWFSGLQLGIL
jgi:hypothetical protein